MGWNSLKRITILKRDDLERRTSMKVLVTGGAGYIGAVLVPHLLENRCRVRVLDNLMYGGGTLLPNVRHPNFEFEHGDMHDESSERADMQGLDAVVHLVAVLGCAA